ncbi:Hypothetical protein R9X50_00349600 [Acrodontium crateriforme]|uniref:Iron transporter n=1 Tax=Acrodontium crateriforme TaxID=150365 RepID=A0AAQ3R4A1_9PEZI|nr:Hypothetical protein R9X50_00349600 [Acrodontium crateriforme]
MSLSTSPSMAPPHPEQHTQHGELIRDCIIGFADGLTVPFALTAGLSSLGSSKLVVVGGLAEIFAGAISMGLGAYLAAVTEKKHYDVEEAREWDEVHHRPQDEEREIYDILGRYGISQADSQGVVQGLKQDKRMWVQFMMDFELKLSRPADKGAWVEGLVMGLSYMLGGILPMIPYFAFDNTNHALFTSIGVTVVILLIFGYFKAIFTGTTRRDAYWSALQTLLIGVLAAGVSYGIIKGIDSALKVRL